MGCRADEDAQWFAELPKDGRPKVSCLGEVSQMEWKIDHQKGNSDGRV